jgi:predicted SAM-dependent methyltransferase
MESELLQLNVGCGPHYATGWTNVDVNPAFAPDFVGDLRRGLELPDASCRLIYLGHVLEHLPMHDVVDALRECGRLLHLDGHMMIVGPDASLCRTDEELETVLALDHAQGAPGGPHQWVPTGPLVGVMLRRAGFAPKPLPIEHVQHPWPVVSHVHWQFAIETRPW